MAEILETCYITIRDLWNLSTNIESAIIFKLGGILQNFISNYTIFFMKNTRWCCFISARKCKGKTLKFVQSKPIKNLVCFVKDVIGHELLMKYMIVFKNV